METFWRLLPGVRHAERRRFGFFFALSGLVAAGQTLGLVGAEALFLARYGVAYLPHAFILASVTTVLGMLLYAALVGVVRNDKMFIQLLLWMALALGGVTWGAINGVPAALPALFALYFLGHAVFVNHFWTFSADYFDLLASKRLFPLFTFGASAGGIVGGATAALLGRFAVTEAVVGAWAIVLVLAALLIRVARHDLVRWGLVDLVEEDESSLEGLIGATRFLRRSALARWMVISAVGMTVALVISQYIYSELFVASFPTASALAAFFGVYLVVSNLLELIVEVFVAPFLIRRLGVARANLVHPILTLLSFGALAFDPRLHAAVLARMNREMVEDSLSTTLRSLVYNAIAPRFRGRVRAFVEGIVVHASLALAGAGLLLWRDVELRWLCAAGGGMALVYLLTNLRIRHAYHHTLIGGLREGRIEVAQLRDRVVAWETPQLADFWQSVIAAGGTYAVRSAEQLAPLLAARQLSDALVQGVSHAEPGVRRASLEALSELADRIPEAVLLASVSDTDPSVRRAAVRALVAREQGGPGPRFAPTSDRKRDPAAERSASRFDLLLRDADPDVRAETALALGAAGRPALAELARSADPVSAVAGLRRITPELADVAAERAQDGDASVRAAALEAVARLAGAVSLGSDRLARDLGHPDARVRSAAVRALASTAAAGSASIEMVCRALADPAREVRQRAVEALRDLDEDALRVVVPYVRAESPGSAEAAIEVLASHRFARSVFLEELQRRVELAWGDLLALRALPPGGDLSAKFLRAAHTDSAQRSEQVAFALLRAIEDPSVVRSIERALRLGSPRVRAQALEVLSNLADRTAAGRLVVMLEHRDLEDRVRDVAKAAELGPELDGAIEADRRALDIWIRLGADYTRKRADEDVSQRETMERLLLLRDVPLFSRLSLEQLDAINQAMVERRYLRGEVVFREGDPAGELFLLVDGQARIVADLGTPEEMTLNQLEAPTYFGEMAILDDQPRSASVVITEDARVLALDGDGFKDLVMQAPEMAFEICRVLSSRVRRLEASG